MTDAKSNRFTRYFPLLLDALRSSAPAPMRPAEAVAWIRRATDVPDEDLSRSVTNGRQSIFENDVSLRHFLIGMAKAPIFAFLIAVIGCLEGFKVAGSAQSVGEHTTSAVVQSIFVVIVVDAIAALFCMEMGL